MATATTINIITKNLDGKAPLYHQYPRQCQPQPAYIELDCRGNGELMADWNGEIGNAVPMYYWHNLAVRWSVPCTTSGESLHILFADDDFLTTCQRIVNGFEERWDGSNYVGRYSQDAEEAIEEAEQMIDNRLDQVEVWDVDDYLFAHCQLSQFWDDQSLEEAVEALENGVENGIEVDGDFEAALVKHAVEALDYRPASYLNRNHIKTLWRRGDITLRQVREWLAEVAA